MSDKRQLIIGDIHGCALTFKKLIFEKLIINKNDKIYLLGDYIDRGPGIKETIDTILDLKNSGFQIFPVMGNHERMLLDKLHNVNDPDVWFYNGAESTLKSFNVNEISELGSEYLDFFENLKYYYVLDDFIITHAGLNFNIDDPLTDIDAMVWNRDYKVDKSKIGGRRLISGHTPHSLEQIRYYLNTDKIQLDGGCVYYKRYIGTGYLCGLELNSMELYPVLNVELSF